MNEPYLRTWTEVVAEYERRSGESISRRWAQEVCNRAIAKIAPQLAKCPEVREAVRRHQ